MNWTLRVTSGSRRDLIRLKKSIDRRLYEEILDAISALEEDPLSVAAPMANYRDHYKIRVRDYRVICYLSDADRLIVVTRIRHRSEAYKGYELTRRPGAPRSG